jgi:prepilin peptidase CpaA
MDLLLIAQSAALVAVMSLALGWDVRTRRIPNAITVSGFVVALGLRAPMGMSALVGGMAGAGFALLLSLPLFALGGLGGGDAKLLVAAGAFLGPQGLATAALAAAVLGGLMAVATMVRRRVWLPVLLSCRDLLLNLVTLGRAGDRPSLDSPGAVKIPYGVAISLGTLLAWFVPLLEGTV